MNLQITDFSQITTLQIISTAIGLLGFILALFLAKNKRTRFIMAASAGLFVGTLTFLLLDSQLDVQIPDSSSFENPFFLTFAISAVLAITIFVNDHLNYPLIHYTSLLILLVFSVLVADIIFPGIDRASLREGIALEILAGGFSTFLIFLTIDSFNDQDADERHMELLKRIDRLQAHIDQLDIHNKKTLHS
ncbi:MAG: cytochrome c biogenesis factor [Cellvibrionaceae bacterium]|jgi:cytochrome c biogenesis factor